jgi:HK97 family phage portal protein
MVGEYVTEGGLLVTDRRHDRGLPPNGNVPVGTVGPDNVNPGRFVMYPEGGLHSEAWSGWPVDWDTPPGGPRWSGYGVGRQGDLFGRATTAMTCVDLNSRQLGSFPCYGVKGDVPFVLPEWASSPEPALYESWPQFVQAAVNSLLLRGEAVTYVTGRYAPAGPGQTGRIARFTLLDPDALSVELVDGQRAVTIAGTEVPPDDVFIVRYQSMPGRLRGITPIEWAAGPLMTAAALERYAADVAGRGGIPWAVLKNARQVTGSQARDAQSAWVAASARRDGAPAVLGNDWAFETVSLSPKDMLLLEVEEFEERRVAAAFGVPAYLVNVEMTSGLTYANASGIRDQHWAATLRTIANLLCSGWSRWLLPRGQRIEMNPDRYVQGPLPERAMAYQTLFNLLDPVTGERAMTIDEIRAAERLAPTGSAPAPDVTDVGAQAMTGGQST